MTEIFDEARARPAAQQPGRRPKKRRGRGWITFLVILLVLAILGVVGYWLSDRLARQTVEQIVSDQVSSRLPEGVSGDVSATLGPGWAVSQALSGRFDELRIDAPNLTAGESSLSAVAELEGVPRRPADSVDRISVTVSLDSEQLASLGAVDEVSGQPSVNDDALTFSGSTSVLGTEITYDVGVTLDTDAGDLLVSPDHIQLDAGVVGIDADELLRQSFGSEPFRVCVADRLPSALTLTDARVESGQLHLTAEGSDLPLTGSGLSVLGTCE